MGTLLDTRERATRLRPERRRRGDVVVAAVLSALVIGGAVVLWQTSPAAGTRSTPAAAPIAEPPPAGAIPAGFVEAWRAPSRATSVPVVAGPAVVTADGSRVVGRDALTGAEAWSYERDRPLCTVGAGFHSTDDGRGRVLALYAGGSEWCSELTALKPDTGERATASNPDVHLGTRFLAAGSSVVATGRDYVEAMRSDLVKTLEYGVVPTPVQAGRQPRPGCTYGSFALVSDRLGVVERCADEPTDRLTVLSPDGDDGADQPQVQFSVPLPAKDAVLVALSGDRAAVAVPGPPRLLLLDNTGLEVGRIGLDVPTTDLADPPGGVTVVERDGERVYWWTGSRTIALDQVDLTPIWTLPGALGPAVEYGLGLLVPVPGGIADVDPVRGTPLRTIPVQRSDAGPVRLAVDGEVLLEQRGGEVVALRPAS